MTFTSDPEQTPATASIQSANTLSLRRFLPRSLFVRALLILVIPMVLLQVIVTYLFLADHETRTTANLTRGVVDQIALVVQLIHGAPSYSERVELTKEASSRLGMVVSYLPGDDLPKERGTTDTQVGEHIGREMATRIPEPHWYDAKRFGEKVDLRVKADDKGVIRFLVARQRFININMHIFPVWMAVFSLLLLGIAALFLRNQIRPIQRLATAAEAFGRGRDVPDFRPAGAREVRSAAIAFIGMKHRIARQMAQRTEMLAGVSHDLRTPLTRMKLELAMMESGCDTSDLKADVAEMERMLEEYLAFARGEGGEQSASADMAEMMNEILEEARRKTGKSVQLSTSGNMQISVKRNALKRCVVNLVENALKYGTHVQSSVINDGAYLDIIVEDDGPGIPDHQHEEAFRPFRRLDESRNLDKGGVGLGLAIARDIARGHGGDIMLSQSALGGLKAQLHIPV